MEIVRNVIVFGDSLSDIGVKWQTPIGRIAKAVGQLTVNRTGRFSDCRNWTDHMYEEATGQTIVKGVPKVTIALSQQFQSLQRNRHCTGVADESWFRYANYAEGGACGGIPNGLIMRIALGQFKHQVDRFRKDYRRLVAEMRQDHGVDITREPESGRTLFLVWFGANDLYTAGASTSDMRAVAEKVANKRRHELAAIVGAQAARFVFMNLAGPLSSVRYVKKFEERSISERKLAELRLGALAFNDAMEAATARNGDAYVDIASAVTQEKLFQMIHEYGLTEGAQSADVVAAQRQDPSFSNSSIAYDHATDGGAPRHLTTSDEAHPTDRIYREVWRKIREALLVREYAFGNLGLQIPSRGMSLVRPRIPEVGTSPSTLAI